MIGYCPGTSLGALGEGRVDALWGILGMLTGAALFAEVYPMIKNTLLTWGNLGSITFPGVLGLNHWFIIPIFVIGGVVMFKWFEKKSL